MIRYISLPFSHRIPLPLFPKRKFQLPINWKEMIRYRGKKIFSFDKHPLLPNTSSTSSRNENTNSPNPLIGRKRWYLLLISVVSTVVKRCFSSTMVINTVVKDFDGHGCDLLPRGVLTRWIGRAILYYILYCIGGETSETFAVWIPFLPSPLLQKDGKYG